MGININIGGAFERTAWTFIQSFAGMIVASGTVGLAGFDWKADLIAAASAAALCVAKILGIAASVTNTTPAVEITRNAVKNNDPQIFKPPQEPSD
jgi:hypothetical protein